METASEPLLEALIVFQKEPEKLKSCGREHLKSVYEAIGSLLDNEKAEKKRKQDAEGEVSVNLLAFCL